MIPTGEKVMTDSEIDEQAALQDALLAGQPDGYEHCEEITVKRKCEDIPELCYEEWQKAQADKVVPGRITSVAPRTNDHLDPQLNQDLKKILKHDEYVGWLRGNIFASMKSSTPGDAITFQAYYEEYVEENTP